MKYAHTPSESPPSIHTATSRAGDSHKSESVKYITQTMASRGAGRFEHDNGDESEEEREKRLKELQDQVCGCAMYEFVSLKFI